MFVFHLYINHFLHTVLYVHAHLGAFAVAHHVHRATGNGDGGVPLEAGILQPLYDGLGFGVRSVVIRMMAFSVPAFAARLTVAVHPGSMVAACFLALAAGFAAGTTVFAVAILVATDHLFVAATSIATAAFAATAPNEETGDAEQQAEYEDLAPIGVHGW